MKIIIILSIIGVLFSIYSYVVGKKARHEKDYKSICDLNDKVSCTTAFTSKYGKILGIKNSLLGILFYIFIFLFYINNYPNLLFYITVVGFIVTIYLAYALYLKLENYCLVCNAIYLINITLLILSHRLYFSI